MSRKPTTGKVVRPLPAIEAYDQVVVNAELKDVRLLKSDFSAKPEAGIGDIENWNSTVDCSLAEVSYSEQFGVVIATITAHAKCKKGRETLISVKCSYLVAYSLSGPVDRVAAEKFVERVGRFAAYPYFRTNFAHLCSQGALLVPPLPIMREGPRKIAPGQVASS